MMTKTDVFGLADSSLVASETADNAQIQVAEAQGEDGFVVAVESFGERTAPSVSYEVVNTISSKSIILGGAISSTGSNSTVPLSISASSSAGGVPTVSVSGQSVPTASVLTGGCKCTVALNSISPLHHAQFFGTGISISTSSTGAHLVNSTWTAEVQLSPAEVDGVIKAYDVTGGKETFTGTIQVSSSGYTAPTLTVPSTWHFSAPLSCTNPNADFPSWTFTVERPLAADA